MEIRVPFKLWTTIVNDTFLNRYLEYKLDRTFALSLSESFATITRLVVGFANKNASIILLKQALHNKSHAKAESPSCVKIAW